MRVFLSYSRQDKRTAEEVAMALETEGHRVFFDRTSLPAGDAFHEEIRREVAAADSFVFLISPSSVRHGSYARTELKFARLKWPNPAGHVLPVLVSPTPTEEIPLYLMAITILDPEGNIAAETADAVSRVRGAGFRNGGCMIRVLTHVASFVAQPDRAALFINVTNLSTDTECEVTHVWLDTTPQAHALRAERPLPVRLVPLGSWETWLYFDRIPASPSPDIFGSARVRLSTGEILTSSKNPDVPDQGFVPGGRA